MGCRSSFRSGRSGKKGAVFMPGQKWNIIFLSGIEKKPLGRLVRFDERLRLIPEDDKQDNKKNLPGAAGP
jgi:hypothetical protein